MTVSSALWGFAGLALLLTIVPGLDTAMVVRSAITLGRRPAVATALGVNIGALTWGVAAAVGAAALLAPSAIAYDGLRIAGAAYMAWLGLSMWWKTLRGKTSNGDDDDPKTRDARLSKAFGRGLYTNLLNPKVGAFYLAVIPQFVPPGVNPLLMGLALAMVHNLLGAVWFGALIASAHAARRWVSRETVRRWIDRITGTALVGFGLKLALSRR